MFSTWPTGVESSSGSGATGFYDTNSFKNWPGDPWQSDHNAMSFSTSDHFNDQLDEEIQVLSAAFGSTDLRPGELMNAKNPPAFDGRMGFFTFEELVLDWIDSCTLSPELRGPALKNALKGEAAIYKPMLDRQRLRNVDDGVNYFLETLRPHFVKGVQATFLHRLFQFMRLRRGGLEISRWLAKYALMRKRLLDAWADLYEPLNRSSTAYMQLHDDAMADYRSRDIDPPESEDAIYGILNDWQKRLHMQKFPFSDNLFTLIFIINSDLDEVQRTTLTQHLNLRGLKMPQYSWDDVRTLYMELLVNPRTELDDPNVRPRNDFKGGNRTFIVEEVGDIEGVTGYWAVDEETGIQGFLDEFSDCFWTMDSDNPQDFTWSVRSFRGRTLQRGKGKGKGKGKSKGFRGRQFFRPRSRFGQTPCPSQDYGSTDWTGKGKKGKKGGKKGDFKGKSKMGGNGKGKGDPSADATAAQVSPPSQATNFGGQAGSPTPDHPSQDWTGDWDNQAWTDDSGWSTEWSDAHGYYSGIFSFVATFEGTPDLPDQPFCDTALAGINSSLRQFQDETALSTFNTLDLANYPTHVILDLGCTRCMGSRPAVEAFARAAVKRGCWCEWKRCHTNMSVAKAQRQHLNGA